ncbi:TonB-dependent receptor [Hymenobacter busanensis]|uniref:TonB-dependent receptor n=1 Tax=Hymenobacter busanensis TaxID=2607656 RepID=A0A7L4ZVK8_9BACT|nr:TonB-dependent receptor [Hymenobacter busanensis]KAA9339181.1 TonB-dependent receptor [Hymenobacter busanensis]QHJ07057.1 SusC/RagA family TonB-linked outer membrane protein [Hymenobacter busanensis]
MKRHVLLLAPLLGVTLVASAQEQRRIQGTVRSADKSEALPGVTVVVKGTTIGATTDPDGKFSLSVPATGDVTLRFSFIGFEAQDVALNDRSEVSVSLKEDQKILDDVVVIGFQEVNRRDVTGSVSSVSAQQIKDIPVNSTGEALAGRLAGVQVTSSEGQPGADIRIRVRGGGSITQDNSPLYVVDGVQVENALSVLSPQDIQSVDVLKDAAATAIYGARGANGVVIITTKGGREGKLSVSYNGFAGFRRATRLLDVLKPADYVDYAYEKAALAGSTTLGQYRKRFGSSTFRDTRDYSQPVGTDASGQPIFGYDTLGVSRRAEFLDWQDRAFGRDAFQQTHNLSVSGGGKGTTFALSLTHNTEDGIQLRSGFVRDLVNFRFEHKASDKFRFGFNTRFNDQVITGVGTSNQGTGSTTNTRLRNTISYVPLVLPGLGDIDPDLNPDDDFFSNSGQLSNPILTLQNEYRADRRRLVNLSGNATFNILKNLSIRSTLGFDNTNTRVETFNGQYSPTVKGANYSGLPFVTIGTGNLVTINNSNVLSYSWKKDKHSLDAVLGHELYQQRNTTQLVQSVYMPLTISEEKAINNINQRDPNAPSTPQPAPTTGRPVDAHLLSGFSRLNYAYADKYLLTATFRADGSSKFKKGNRWGYFPAASAAWRISQEDFMQSMSSTVSDLKLRLSYGLAGNNRIQDFLYDPIYSTGGNIQYAILENILPGSAPTRLANPDLKWETTVSRNLGVDLGLFNNRLQFTVDAYTNRTRDLLVDLNIPPTSGYTTQTTNIGATSNKGVELQLSGTVVQTPEFTYTANTNIAFNRNKVVSLGPGRDALDPQYSGWASTEITADYLVQVGQPVGLMYGYVTDGFYTADDFDRYDTALKRWVLKPGVVTDKDVTGYSGVTDEVIPGTIKLKDLNGDGKVTPEDRQVIGNANPKFTGGLNQQFAYKGFDASVFVNWVVGNDIYNANKIEQTSYLPNTYLSNGLAIMKDRYRTIDDNGQIITDLETTRRLNQNAKIWSPQRKVFLHSWAVEDGSFLRINNVTLGYTLPKSITRRAKLEQVRFYATANNIYTFTKYTGYDPDVNVRRGGNAALTPGVDYAAYPRSRAFLFGVNLSL